MTRFSKVKDQAKTKRMNKLGKRVVICFKPNILSSKSDSNKEDFDFCSDRWNSWCSNVTGHHGNGTCCLPGSKVISLWSDDLILFWKDIQMVSKHTFSHVLIGINASVQINMGFERCGKLN